MTMAHVPVMATDVVEALAPAGADVVVDMTVGAGGHARALADRLGPAGLLLGIDRDPRALELAAAALAGAPPRVVLTRGAFADLDHHLASAGVRAAQAVLMDLGVSSMQLDDPDRGFGYGHDGPLDMRQDPDLPRTAADLVNTLSASELTRIISDFGEERWASRIAAFLVAARQRSPLTTTAELVAVVKAAIPAGARRHGPHPARRTFQALRLAVNDELGQLASGLEQALAALAPDGRLAVLSYHSLEDRLVKRALVAARQRGYVPLWSRPRRPGAAEVGSNPRARSARLRAVRRGPVLAAEEAS